MILIALMLVLASWLVQQQAELPSLASISVLLMLATSLWCQAFPRVHATLQDSVYLKHLRICLITFLLGIIWASSFAYWRLHDELPAEWQQKTIEVIGVVASVPEITDNGVRFHFNVEKIITPGAVVPRHISLNQY